MRKLASTIRICATLFMARTFGRYRITIWDGTAEYVHYEWRGETWAFPKAPLESAQ